MFIIQATGVFVPWKLFQPSLTFASKRREHIKGAPHGWAQVLLRNMELG